MKMFTVTPLVWDESGCFCHKLASVQCVSVRKERRGNLVEYFAKTVTGAEVYIDHKHGQRLYRRYGIAGDNKSCCIASAK